MKNGRSKLIAWIVFCISCCGFSVAQQQPAAEHRFAFFASGIDPHISQIAETPEGERIEVRLGNQTGFSLSNPGDEAVQVLIRFLSTEGEEVDVPLVESRLAGGIVIPAQGLPASLSIRGRSVPALSAGHVADQILLPQPLPNPFELAPGASIRVVTDVQPGSPLQVGSVRIECSAPIAALQSLASAWSLSTVPAVLVFPAVQSAPSQPVRRFQASVLVDALNDSGLSLAVADPLAGDVSGSLRLLDSRGREISTLAVTVRPGEQQVVPISSLFPAISSLNGSIVAEFDGELLVASLAFDRFSPFLELNLISRLP